MCEMVLGVMQIDQLFYYKNVRKDDFVHFRFHGLQF